MRTARSEPKLRLTPSGQNAVWLRADRGAALFAAPGPGDRVTAAGMAVAISLIFAAMVPFATVPMQRIGRCRPECGWNRRWRSLRVLKPKRSRRCAPVETTP